MNFLISAADAQEAPSGVQGMLQASGLSQFIPLILIFVVFYMLLIRPQQQAQKALKTQIAAIKRGDRVLTAGGILATVQKVKDGSNEIEVDLAPNIRVTVIRDTITSVLSAATDSPSDKK